MGYERLPIYSFFAVVFFGCLSCQTTPIKVSIYYQSLGPDSMIFIEDELFKNYDNFKDRIIVDFVPYGRASQTKNIAGEWVFRCQYGEDECSGNKYQACALNQKKGQDNDVKFVHCVMTQGYPSDPDVIKNCSDQNGYDWDALTKCYEYGLGSDLLAAYGNRTHSSIPKLRFVPTIIFDDKYDHRIQDLSWEDFADALCSKLSDPKPVVCQS